MATLTIRTKTDTENQPGLIERFARRFYAARMNSAIREIERRPFLAVSNNRRRGDSPTSRRALDGSVHGGGDRGAHPPP